MYSIQPSEEDRQRLKTSLTQPPSTRRPPQRQGLVGRAQGSAARPRSSRRRGLDFRQAQQMMHDADQYEREMSNPKTRGRRGR